MKLEDMVGKVIQGDCLDVVRDIPDKSIDLILTDPPYGIERFKDIEKETTGCYAKRGAFKNASYWNNNKLNKLQIDEIFRISKNQIIFGGNNFDLPTSEYFIIWDKKQMMPNFARCEFAWVSVGLKQPAKIYEYSIMKLNANGRQHPAEKPIELLEYILRDYSKETDLILDPFAGSGTTGLACERLNRKYILIEISESYCSIARERIELERKQIKLLL